MASSKPIIGNWYQNAEVGSVFEVVAFDEEEETVEISMAKSRSTASTPGKK